MATMNVEEKVFQLPIDVTENGVVTKVLATADTYVDKNIKVTVNTPDATYEVKQAAAVTATVSSKDDTYTSDTETPYAITIAADATAGAVQVGVKDAGFAAATDVVTVDAADAEQDTKTIYVKEGHLAGEGEASAESKTVKMTKGGAGDFQITAKAAGSVKVDVAGWLPANATADASGDDATYAIQAASLANTAGDGEYEEKDAPVLTSGGYLYINEGYIKDTKISLATLIPDNANITDENANLVYNTVKAYDKDGALIVGTMGDAELGAITADDAAATISNVTVAADEGVFKVSGKADIAGTASVEVSKRGLAETTLNQTGVIEGEATVDATLAKIGLNVSVGDDDLEVTPVIAKEDATTVKSGDITTTAPEGRYIAVSTAAIEASTNVMPGVATEGYGTADLHSATGANVKAGAAASGTYYIPVEAGSHSAVAGDATVVNASATVATNTASSDGFDGDLTAGILASAPEGEYIVISADATAVKGSVSGTVTCTATEGYIEAAQETASISGDVEVEVTAAANKYIRVYDGTIL